MEMSAGFGFLRKSRQANACLAKGYVYLPKKAATQTGLYLAARRGILPVNGKEFKNGGFATNTAKAPSAKGG